MDFTFRLGCKNRKNQKNKGKGKDKNQYQTKTLNLNNYNVYKQIAQNFFISLRQAQDDNYAKPFF
jgi:hypothetical protein